MIEAITTTTATASITPISVVGYDYWVFIAIAKDMWLSTQSATRITTKSAVNGCHFKWLSDSAK